VGLIFVASALVVGSIAGPASGHPRRADPLHQATYWLEDRGAERVEDLSNENLLTATTLTGSTWKRRMASLARQEAGRRRLTNDAFPEQAGPPSRTRKPMTLSAADLEILARIVKGETWPETPRAGRVAVAAVVLNRVAFPGYPKTVAGVAHQPMQFSCYNEDVRARLYEGPIPAEAMKAAREAAAGADPAPGATHYFNPYLVSPSWAKKMKYVDRIGETPLNTQDFYR
jgi:spore germination cell wall hydrolase CwlJ-like protein